MTNKMTGYLGLASVLLCLMLMTACTNSSTSGSSGGAHGTSATATSKASAAAMIARKASGQKNAPKATPKPVVITMPPKPTSIVAPAPTQPPAPVVVPTTPPMMMPTPTTPAVIVTNPGVPAAAAAVLTLINQERKSQNIGPLTWDAELQKSAHAHNLAMAAVNILSHQLSGEAAFGDRERAQGVNWTSAAENIALSSINQGETTSDTADGLNTGMFNETPPDDGHRVNILATSSNMVGIDVLIDTVHNKIWLTEDFAHV